MNISEVIGYEYYPRAKNHFNEFFDDATRNHDVFRTVTPELCIRNHLREKTSLPYYLSPANNKNNESYDNVPKYQNY
jgi:hypothetical protein